MASLAACGTVTCAFAVSHATKKCANTPAGPGGVLRRTLFLMLLLDAAVSSFCCLTEVMLFLALLYYDGDAGKLLCSLMVLAPFAGCFFGSAYMAAIAYVRYSAVCRALGGGGHYGGQATSCG